MPSPIEPRAGSLSYSLRIASALIVGRALVVEVPLPLDEASQRLAAAAAAQGVTSRWTGTPTGMATDLAAPQPWRRWGRNRLPEVVLHGDLRGDHVTTFQGVIRQDLILLIYLLVPCVFAAAGVVALVAAPVDILVRHKPDLVGVGAFAMFAAVLAARSGAMGGVVTAFNRHVRVLQRAFGEPVQWAAATPPSRALARPPS